MSLAPFADLVVFEALDSKQRLAFGAPLAESLGKGFRAHASLVGSKGMVAVEHVPSGVLLVAVPGGSFEMGLTERDDEEVKACVDYDAGVIQSTLQRLELACSPVHRVTVSPFLLSAQHLFPPQVAAVRGPPATDILSPDAAAAFVRDVCDFRLPSEAELEYVGREGGSLSFLHDSGRVWSTAHRFPHEGGWGFRDLQFAAWAADEWHDDYDGAPSTTVAWTHGGAPRVYRGCLIEPPTSEAEVLFALAACRGRVSEDDDDDWPIGLRVARSITI